MITKKMYAHSILEKHAESENIKVSDITENDIYKSSSVAVAMEFLGMLESQEAKDYAEERGGTQILYIDREEMSTHILSAREILGLLPDTI